MKGVTGNKKRRNVVGMKGKKTLAERFSAVLTWCSDKDIKPVRFFTYVDPSLDDHYIRIRYVMNARAPQITDTDEPWLSSMEATIDAINSRKQVAA